MKVPRIAFSGCSGTGKTTLAKWAAEEFGLPFCTVLSRDVVKEMGYATAYDLPSIEHRIEFQRTMFERKRAWEREHYDTGFVTERSQLDEFVYGVMHCHDAYTMEWIHEVLEAQLHYSHVYILPKAFHQVLAGDPARKGDPAYHEIYEGVLRGFTENVRGLAPETVYATMPYKDLERRKETIRRDIEEYTGRQGEVVH